MKIDVASANLAPPTVQGRWLAFLFQKFSVPPTNWSIVQVVDFFSFLKFIINAAVSVISETQTKSAISKICKKMQAIRYVVVGNGLIVLINYELLS